MKEGDLITTYFKGFYRLKRIERRYLTQYEVDTYSTHKGKKAGDQYSPLFYFIQEYTDDGKPVKTAKEKACDAVFCKLVSDYIKEEVEKFNIRITALEAILDKK